MADILVYLCITLPVVAFVIGWEMRGRQAERRRAGRQLILVEDDPDPHPAFFDEHDLAVIAMHEDDPGEGGP